MMHDYPRAQKTSYRMIISMVEMFVLGIILFTAIRADAQYVVFVTSTTFDTTTGTAGATTKCRQEAVARNLPQASINTIAIVNGAAGLSGWVNGRNVVSDGGTFIATSDDFKSASLSVSLSDAGVCPYPFLLWTGLKSGFTSGSTCSNWGSVSSGVLGNVADCTLTIPSWIGIVQSGCNQQYRILCAYDGTTPSPVITASPTTGRPSQAPVTSKPSVAPTGTEAPTSLAPTPLSPSTSPVTPLPTTPTIPSFTFPPIIGSSPGDTYPPALGFPPGTTVPPFLTQAPSMPPEHTLPSNLQAAIGVTLALTAMGFIVTLFLMRKEKIKQKMYENMNLARAASGGSAGGRSPDSNEITRWNSRDLPEAVVVTMVPSSARIMDAYAVSERTLSELDPGGAPSIPDDGRQATSTSVRVLDTLTENPIVGAGISSETSHSNGDRASVRYPAVSSSMASHQLEDHDRIIPDTKG